MQRGDLDTLEHWCEGVTKGQYKTKDSALERELAAFWLNSSLFSDHSMLELAVPNIEFWITGPNLISPTIVTLN